MKKILSAIALALTLTLVVPAAAPQTAVVASAATKTKKTTLSSKSATIAICGTKTISLKNKNSKASYSFSSNKKSVATVSSKGVVTGKAAGTAKITVKQKLKGKTTTVGTFKVTVKKAQLTRWASQIDKPLDYLLLAYIPSQPGLISKENPLDMGAASGSGYIEYPNKNAKYYWYSDGKDVVITKDGKITAVKKTTGNTKLIIKETYKGKTRVVGTVPYHLSEPFYMVYGADTNDEELYIGETLYLDENLYYCGQYNYQIYEDEEPGSDEEIINVANGPDSDGSSLKYVDVVNGTQGLEIKAKAAGTVYVVLTQYNFKSNKYDKVFARFKIDIPDTSKLDNFSMEYEADDYNEELFDENDEVYVDYYDVKKNELNLTYFAEGKWEDFWIFTNPERYTGSFEISSSDPNVVEASEYNDGAYDHKLRLVYRGEGKAVVTIKSGEIEKSVTVVVKKADSYEDDDYDYDDEEDW